MSAAGKPSAMQEPGLYSDVATYAVAVAIAVVAAVGSFTPGNLAPCFLGLGATVTFFWIAMERRDLLRAAEVAAQSAAEDWREADTQKGKADDAE